jgi:wyosine [tRNA(Phe)-imidazoG37] synthetase (radical SAM superfamily)
LNYTFGPINSRRFGLSLGIDLSPDVKSCNFDCLYCELKAAKPIDKIPNPPKVSDIISDVKEAIKKEPNIEVITITSNGEPTLYNELDTLVDELNKIKEDKKLLILSNASMISYANIQATLKKIDIVKLSLDCATQKCFQKIDRPIKGILVSDIIDGIKTFSQTFSHDLIIEVLVVKGVNDKEEEMDALNLVLQEINPCRIDLGTIDRPPAFDVKPVSSETLKNLSSHFYGLPISIIHKDKPKTRIDLSEDDILHTIKRRPQSQSDVDYLFSEISKQNLKKLLDEKKVVKQTIAGVIFYSDENWILSK